MSITEQCGVFGTKKNKFYLSYKESGKTTRALRTSLFHPPRRTEQTALKLGSYVDQSNRFSAVTRVAGFSSQQTTFSSDAALLKTDLPLPENGLIHDTRVKRRAQPEPN